MIAYKINTNETEEELQEAFRIFDRTNSGFITYGEILIFFLTKHNLRLRRFDDIWHVMNRLGENLTKSEVREMMREADRDLSGRITLAEFAEMIRYS